MVAMRWLTRVTGLAAAGLLAAGCSSMTQPTLERTTRGPNAEEFFIAQSVATNGRPPSFAENVRVAMVDCDPAELGRNRP